MPSERRPSAVAPAILGIAALIAFAILPIASAGAQPHPTVEVISSSAGGPFGQAADALIESLRSRQPPVAIRRLDLQGDGRADQAAIEPLLQSQPALVVTVGSLATSMVLSHGVSAPVAFSMVLYPAHSGYVEGRNVTGVALDVPLERQFTTLRELLPKARRIGVLYHRDETGSIVAAARAAAEREGMILATHPVDNPSAIPALLPSFLAGVDAVWMVADSHVLNPRAVESLMLQSLRMSVPVFGLNQAQVEMGALVAFGFDYADVGRQTGELAVRLLNGERAAAIPPLAPRKLYLRLNQRSARHLGITIPAELDQQASEVIQ